MGNKLGLPLEYSELHEFFDALGPKVASKENRLLEKILKKYKVKSVLDLTCGTGKQLLYFAKKGFNVTGSDFSPKLVKAAKKKAKLLNLNVDIIEGDMRTIRAGEFDAVITIANAIGHLTRADFKKTLKNIHHNLNADGLYLFDILNVNAMDDKTVDDIAMDHHRSINGETIHNIQYSQMNRKTNRLTSYDRFIVNEDTPKMKVYESKFSLQIYTAKELRDLLSKNGFDIVTQMGFDGAKFNERKTLSILTIAKKK